MNGEPERKELVLVVDDNEPNRLLAQQTLEDEGYSVILATGGAEGVAAFERHPPDCVLLDVRMPGIDGIAACQQMRRIPGGQEVPIVFLTAQRDVDTLDRALQVGADDFLTKPVRPAELIVRVQAALKVRRLGSELRGLVELLRHQRDDLLRLQLQKERLSAFVVHDLKNPVNVMDLHAQLLLREKNLSESGRQAAAQIRYEARQVNRMLLNLLDLSKGDEGKLTPKRTEVDLQSHLDEVFSEIELSARARNVTLRSEAMGITARADVDLLRRMLVNLIENAIRHSPMNGAVRVVATEQNGTTEIRVSDEGPGIPREMREKVFDPFVQIESGDRTVTRAGRGLGLAFCKLVAQAHAGTIWIEDAAPGAIFCVKW